MLLWLKIKNYLLIENLDITIPRGFITMTGETGAGKSVLLGAISLLTGKRADVAVILDKDKKCIIEACFKISDNLKSFFEQNELDFDNETILRREISPKGKSRAFINDTPVNLNTLKSLTENLIDIHSQHQSLLLKKSDFRINVIDSFADSADQLSQYQKVFTEYQKTNSELEKLKQNLSEQIKEKDYLEFQLDELEEAQLKGDELIELQEEESLLNHAEEIQNVLNKSSDIIKISDTNILDVISSIQSDFDSLLPQFKKSEEYSKRLESVRIELKDLADSFENDASSINNNPARLTEVRERIDIINQLLVKHQKNDEKELLEYKQQTEERLLQLNTDRSRVEELEEKEKQLFNDLENKADALSKKRRKSIPELEKKILEMLKYLGMPEGRFNVEIDKAKQPTISGFDNIEFLFSANKKIKPELLQRVASGGEISRLMLCLKSIVAIKQKLPTIIFDEIDTGVSGEIAGKMGNMMANLAEKSQIISITHLAQVAAKGKTQFHVVKENSRTRIKELKTEERIAEIAKMSSGEDVGEAAIEHAKNLLKSIRI